jgi:hypothetical protein
MPENSGVYIGGGNTGNISTGHINTGNHVTQTVQISGDPQTTSTLERIDQLLAALLASVEQLPAESAEVVTDEAEWLRGEIQHDQLHARHVRHALAALAEAAAPVLPIMNLVTEVTDLVVKLLH